MAQRLKLVQGDTRPPVVIQLTDDAGAIDLSSADTVIRMDFREEGSTTVIATIVGAKLTGYIADTDTGVINQAAPYNVAGAGGRVQFSWAGTTALSGEAGNYEGEVYVTYPDGTVQTAYDLLKFKLREDF